MGWFGKLFAAAILISLLSVFTTVYLVDQYVEAILDRWNLSDVERPSLKLGELFSSLASLERMDSSDSTTETDDNPDKSTSSPDEWNPQINVEKDGTDAPNGAVKANASPVENDKLPLDQYNVDTDQAVPVSGQVDPSRIIVMSAEEFNNKRKKLSDGDKLEIFSLLMQKLPQQELQRMSELLEDGITEDELAELEEVINAYLHKDDVDRLLLILNKY